MNIDWIRFVVAGLLAVVCQGVTWANDVQFTEHLLQDGFGYAYGLAAGDLNGDGRPEIIVADASGGFQSNVGGNSRDKGDDKGELSCFVNHGGGNFTRFYIKQGEKGWFERNTIGDVDGDGNPDVVVVKNLSEELLLFKNPGKNIETQPWTRQLIATKFKRAYDVCLLDLNGDGRTDVAASAFTGNQIAWFQNPGNGSASWKMYVIDEGVGETRTIRAADFNGDGRSDLMATGRTGNLVAWYENPGSSSTRQWTRHIIDDASVYPTHGEPVDINGDGKLDVVMAFGHYAPPQAGQVCWYENIDDGKRWKKHLIGTLPIAFEAVGGDLNGDGKADVVATAWGLNGQLVWFENPGELTKNWTRHVLKDHWSKANSVLMIDLDDDSRLDIVAAAERGSNEVRWWYNEGKRN